MLLPSNEIKALRAAATTAESQFISIDTSVDPIALSRVGAGLFQRAHLVCSPNGDAAVGLGAYWAASASGEGRFDDLGGQIAAVGFDAAPTFLGFSFHPDGAASDAWAEFASAEAVMAEITLHSQAGGNRLTVAAGSGERLDSLIELLATLEEPGPLGVYEPGDHAVESHPPSAEWKVEVDEALGAIARGDLAKVVLGRSVILTTENAPEAFELLGQLRDWYPQCYVFAWQAGDAVFIGASPELLLDKRQSRVRVNPLAGSARRGEGEIDDRSLGEALLASAKDRREHQLVVDDIASRLAPLVTSLDIPSRPSLRRMATVQHLSTEIAGEATAAAGPLQLVAAMHPTPAVGGTPRAAALAFVDKVEGIDRGWYTGGIGWVTSEGDATVAIPLRCALIRGRTSHLYAGAGVVEDSTPDGELDETRLKLRPMLSLLTAS